MTIKYHERGRCRNMPVVRALFATNLAFAIAILVSWQLTMIVILGPLGWAADQPIPTAHTLENLLTYPLLLFWGGPAAAMAIGWTLLQSQRYKAACGVLLMPVVVSLLLIAVYLTHPGATAL